MEIPGLGAVVEDADMGWHVSEPVPVPILGGTLCRVTVAGYDDDPAPEEIHAAIRAFLALDPSALTAIAPSIFAYYRDIMDDVIADGDDEWYLEIQGPQDVLGHVRLGDQPTVSRNSRDRRVYVSLECGCDWEPEHGLQIVFRDGQEVTKVGPYDGHLTNAAAYADDTLEGVVYYRPGHQSAS